MVNSLPRTWIAVCGNCRSIVRSSSSPGPEQRDHRHVRRDDDGVLGHVGRGAGRRPRRDRAGALSSSGQVYGSPRAAAPARIRPRGRRVSRAASRGRVRRARGRGRGRPSGPRRRAGVEDEPVAVGQSLGLRDRARRGDDVGEAPRGRRRRARPRSRHGAGGRRARGSGPAGRRHGRPPMRRSSRRRWRGSHRRRCGRTGRTGRSRSSPTIAAPRSQRHRRSRRQHGERDRPGAGGAQDRAPEPDGQRPGRDEGRRAPPARCLPRARRRGPPRRSRAAARRQRRLRLLVEDVCRRSPRRRASASLGRRREGREPGPSGPAGLLRRRDQDRIPLAPRLEPAVAAPLDDAARRLPRDDLVDADLGRRLDGLVVTVALGEGLDEDEPSAPAPARRAPPRPAGRGHPGPTASTVAGDDPAGRVADEEPLARDGARAPSRRAAPPARRAGATSPGRAAATTAGSAR